MSDDDTQLQHQPCPFYSDCPNTVAVARLSGAQSGMAEKLSELDGLRKLADANYIEVTGLRASFEVIRQMVAALNERSQLLKEQLGATLPALVARHYREVQAAEAARATAVIGKAKAEVAEEKMELERHPVRTPGRRAEDLQAANVAGEVSEIKRLVRLLLAREESGSWHRVQHTDTVNDLKDDADP
jgi:hypothetical protein